MFDKVVNKLLCQVADFIFVESVVCRVYRKAPASEFFINEIAGISEKWDWDSGVGQGILNPVTLRFVKFLKFELT